MNPKSHRLLWITLGVIALLGTALGAYFLNGDDNLADTVETDAQAPAAMAPGYVEPEKGITRLYPAQPGRVIFVIEEGKRVSEKEVLLRLDQQKARALLARARADHNNADIQLQKAKIEEENFGLKKDAQRVAITMANFAVEIAEKEYEYAKTVVKGGAEHKVVEQKAWAKWEAAKEQVKLEKLTLKKLEAYDPALDVAQAEANLKDKKAQLDLAQHALDETEVKAPSEGDVLRVDTNVGEMLGPNPRGPAIEFAPKGPRIVRAEVLQEWADRVFIGQEVHIESDPRTTQQWKGKVSKISDWIKQKRNPIMEPLVFNDVRTLDCVIEIIAGPKDLRIGQRVRATFMPKK